MQHAKEKPFINLPNGKRISFAYLSRVANGDKPISLEQLKKSHLWSTLDQNEKSRLLASLNRSFTIEQTLLSSLHKSSGKPLSK